MMLWLMIGALAAPTARWGFEGDLQDELGALDATVISGSIVYGDGYASFDGTTSVGADSAGSLMPGSTSFSVIARVTPETTSGTQAIASRYECGDLCISNVSTGSIYLRIRDGSFNFSLRDQSGDTVDVSSSPIVAGETYTLIGSADRANGVLRLIVDDLVYETPLPVGFAAITDADASPDPWTIGARKDAGGSGMRDFYEGDIHYIVWDDAPLDSSNKGFRWFGNQGITPAEEACFPLDDSGTGSIQYTADAMNISTSSFGENRLFLYRENNQPVDASGRSWVEAELRVVSNSNQSGWIRRATTIQLCTGVNSGAAVEIGDGAVFLRNGDNSASHQVSVDTSVFHTYTVVSDPHEDRITISVDGTEVIRSPVWNFSQYCSERGLFAGEGSILASGSSDWRYLAHNVAVGPDVDADGWVDCPEVCNAKDDDHNGIIDDPNVCGCRHRAFLTSEYLACPRQATWDEAHDVCALEGYDMVSIETPQEDDQINNRLLRTWPDRYWWLGATDRDTEGVHAWESSGSPLLYSDWFPGQPDDFGTGQDCAGMWPAGRGWFDVRCDRHMSFICERPL